MTQLNNPLSTKNVENSHGMGEFWMFNPDKNDDIKMISLGQVIDDGSMDLDFEVIEREKK